MSETARDILRSATVGASVVKNHKIVEWNGHNFEVRSPTLKQQKHLKKVSTDPKTKDQDAMKALCHGIIECVYIPGTDEKVFEPSDVDNMMDRGISDFIGVFMKTLADLSDVKPEDIEKNSESDPIG